ncbi:hypothetical protein FNW02_28795 [Komarekiella sp. 'clone 1']|uniref:Uncharacterized protein n=1 Tax=Komarekiella delphini-convector SJRDD-AB1 TaxID=2593771 RepID=A0AA40T2W7_9NOST|nr:hypothetical protein [Komarekiella delphini-convector]MBD6619708.1 hypothetical protein [Komarekiella delphini-convector SJRDD-AB1]
MSKSALKNKVDSIRRTLKTKGIEVSGTVIESKLLEMFPNFESDWCPDARSEVIKALTSDLQPTELATVDSSLQTVDNNSVSNLSNWENPTNNTKNIGTELVSDIEDLQALAHPKEETISTQITLSDANKRALTRQKSQELGINLNDSEINSIADSVEHCGDSLDEMLGEIQSALIAYIDHNASLNTQKIDTALDNVVEYAEQKFTQNSQHLSNRLRTFSQEIEAVATHNKSQIKSILSRLAIPAQTG